MSGQSIAVPNLLAQRMRVISQLSQENSGLLRFLQQQSGHQVLLMKDPDAANTLASKHQIEAQLDACQQRITKLEQELSGIDAEIAAATHEEQEDG